MKVLLINPDSNYVKEKPVMPLGLLSIATYLAQNEHTVKVLDRTVEHGKIKRFIEDFSPDAVGLSVLAFTNFSDAVKISKIAKERHIPVIWGGHIPTLVPDIVLKSKVVDYIVIGEGEITMLALINTIASKTAVSHINGLAYTANGQVVFTPRRDFADLSLLPIIDFSFVEPQKYLIYNTHCKKVLHLYTAKGCPGKCTFCYNPCFHSSVWRARPAGHYIAEIKQLTEFCGIDGVCFADDLLSPREEHTIQLCKDIIESKLNILWGCDMRADKITQTELVHMYNAGCRWIFFGIESGSERIQREIKKGIDFKKASETIDLCKSMGISTTASFIIGYPDETVEDIKQTISFIQSLNADIKIGFAYGAIPSTEMYLKLIRNNKMQEPGDYKEWQKLRWFDSLSQNFSLIPSLDLKVILSYFFFKLITNKKENKRFRLTQSIKQTLDILKGRNIKSIYLFVITGTQFVSIFTYANLFPRIKKKYNLE